MTDRTPLFSVTLDDCDVQHFRAGGPGGQNQNKRDTATRIIHRASGARGESREHRTQLQNTRAALKRMADSTRFRAWAALESDRLAGRMSPEEQVEAMLADPAQTRTEVRDENGRWVDADLSTDPLAS